MSTRIPDISRKEISFIYNILSRNNISNIFIILLSRYLVAHICNNYKFGKKTGNIKVWISGLARSIYKDDRSLIAY